MTSETMIQTGPLTRDFPIQATRVDTANRTVEVSFSSEIPVERWFGFEILDHSRASVRLDRLRASGSVLVGHREDDVVGVVESARIDKDRKGRAVVRFGTSPRAQEIFEDVRNGIRRNMSIGYRVHRMVPEESEATEGPKTYRAVDWEPMELSLVAVPADETVGVGRSAENSNTTLVDTRGESIMSQVQLSPEANQARRETLRTERERARTIVLIGERLKLPQEEVDRAIREGTSLEDFRRDVTQSWSGDEFSTLVPQELPHGGRREFSLCRLIASEIDRKVDAGFEREICAEYARNCPEKPRGYAVPHSVLGTQKRALSVGTATAGGNLVATNLIASEFIDLLRNEALTIQAGARVLPGLVGTVAIPRQTTGATAAWVAEAGTITPSDQAFDQVTLSPKLLTGGTVFSRQLMVQSTPQIEGVVRQDLIRQVAVELDRAAINGSGSGAEPLGILGITGVGLVALGTNGAAPTYSNIVDLQREVAIDNADLGARAFLTNAKARAKLLKVDKGTDTGNFVWESDVTRNEGRLIGVRAFVSNNAPSNLVKGTSGAVCSAIIYGNWNDLLIGLWGGLDIVVDPYTSAATGQIRVFIYQYADIDVRHPESFAKIVDALTT